MNIINLAPVVRKIPTTMKSDKPHKFSNFKKKFIKFEQKRFSRIKDDFNKVKDTFTEDINDIDQIMKETFQESDEEEESTINVYDIEQKNDAFFD